MENEILEIMEAGMKRRLIFSDMLELQKIARAVNLATKAHYEAKILKIVDDLLFKYRTSFAIDIRGKIADEFIKSQLTKQP